MGELAHVPTHLTRGDDCAFAIPGAANNSNEIEARPSQRFAIKPNPPVQFAFRVPPRSLSRERRPPHAKSAGCRPALPCQVFLKWPRHLPDLSSRQRPPSKLVIPTRPPSSFSFRRGH